MKKALALVLVLACLPGLAACADAADENGAVETPDAGVNTPVDNGEPSGKPLKAEPIPQQNRNERRRGRRSRGDRGRDQIRHRHRQPRNPGIGSPLTDASGNILPEGGKAPTELIPEEIVAAQSVQVDTVSGATITSAAIIGAVTDCLTQAGAKIDEWKTAPPQRRRRERQRGRHRGGRRRRRPAAAVSAAQNGASVIVVEKNGEVGGDTLVCGAIYNSPDEALRSQVTMTDAVKNTIEAALAETR